MARERTTASLAALGEGGQAQAMARFAVLRPHLEDGVPLTRAATAAGVPLRTAPRWLARYDAGGCRSPDLLHWPKMPQYVVGTEVI